MPFIASIKDIEEEVILALKKIVEEYPHAPIIVGGKHVLETNPYVELIELIRIRTFCWGSTNSNVTSHGTLCARSFQKY